ncbi:hypothetical protein SLA2020_327440 [Shorea laevis]
MGSLSILYCHALVGANKQSMANNEIMLLSEKSRENAENQKWFCISSKRLVFIQSYLAAPYPKLFGCTSSSSLFCPPKESHEPHHEVSVSSSQEHSNGGIEFDGLTLFKWTLFRSFLPHV